MGGKPGSERFRAITDPNVNGEIFYTRLKAKVLIERWRQHYNRVPPHSALGYPAGFVAATPDGGHRTSTFRMAVINRSVNSS